MNTQAVQNAAQCYDYLRSQFSSEDKHQLQFAVMDGLTSYVPKPTMLALQDAIVFSGEWFVATNGRIFGDLYLQTPIPLISAYIVGVLTEKIRLIHERPKGASIERAFLLGGCRNYCHWMLDYVPRLLFDKDISLPILVNGNLAEFQRESLNLLGVDSKRLVRLAYPATYHVKNLAYPSTFSSSFTPPLKLQPWIMEWLRTAFASSMTSGRSDRKLFISRAGEEQLHQRRLLNHDEITDVAKRYDFEIVSPEKLKVADQINLFSQAGMIAGPHGAGFANMVFAPKSTKVFEFVGPQLCQNKVLEGFLRLGAALQQPVTRLVGETQGPVERGVLPFETYTIKPETFAQALESAHKA